MAGVCVLEEKEGWFCIYRVLEKIFFAFIFIFYFLVLEKLKKNIYIVLMWKIVGVSEDSVMYILVIGPCVARFYEKNYKINV